MRRLDTTKRATILQMLVEGSSLRSISRITGTSINTVTKLLVDAGRARQIREDGHRGVQDRARPADNFSSSRRPYRRIAQGSRPDPRNRI